MSVTLLTPSQLEAIAVFVEECGEALQAAGKLMRHGPVAFDGPNVHMNCEELNTEVGQVLYALDLLTRVGLLSVAQVEAAFNERNSRAEQYLHHVGKDDDDER